MEKEQLVTKLKEQGIEASLHGDIPMIHVTDPSMNFLAVQKLVREMGYSSSYGCTFAPGIAPYTKLTGWSSLPIKAETATAKPVEKPAVKTKVKPAPKAEEKQEPEEAVEEKTEPAVKAEKKTESTVKAEKKSEPAVKAEKKTEATTKAAKKAAPTAKAEKKVEPPGKRKKAEKAAPVVSEPEPETYLDEGLDDDYASDMNDREEGFGIFDGYEEEMTFGISGGSEDFDDSDMFHEGPGGQISFWNED